MTRATPYPADTRAKGWRFEIDYEKVEQSDTWDLATEIPMAQPALLMMWLMAWTQVPCGSMPADENLIRVKCRIPPKLWPALKPILMRGWWEAEDGRLYHDTLVERVMEMLEYRRKEAERRNRNRAKPGVPPALSRVTTGGHTPDATGTPDTGTGTGTSHTQVEKTHLDPHADVCVARGGKKVKPPKETPAGLVAAALRRMGIEDASAGHAELVALLDKGVPQEAFEGAAKLCLECVPPKGIAYLLGIVKNQLAAAVAVGALPGMPGKPWDYSRSTIEAKGVELGLGPWNESDLSSSRETFQRYTERVRAALGRGQAEEVA